MEPSKVLILHRKVNSRRGPTAAALLALAALLAAAGAPAKSYRWVDDSGEVVYSQLPPEDGRPSTVIGAPPPPAETPEQASRRLREQLQQSADRAEDEELAGAAAAKSRQGAAESARLCAAARDNLAKLEQGGANRRFRNAAGEYERLTEESWEEQKARARAIIAEHCP